MKKRIVIYIFVVCLLLTGCSFLQPNEKETTDSVIHGDIAVSTEKEYDFIKPIIDKMFNALEAKDKEAIKNLFSDYAKEHISDLDGKIDEFISLYPGADGGYKSSSVSSEVHDKGVSTEALKILLTITNQDLVYKISICAYLKDDTNPSKVGVHIIEMTLSESLPGNLKWKGVKADPGINIYNNLSYE